MLSRSASYHDDASPACRSLLLRRHALKPFWRVGALIKDH